MSTHPPNPSDRIEWRTASLDSLPAALAVRASGEIVSVVGGGGKSALLFGLGRTLPGCTILTTTTRIFAAQTERATKCVAYGSAACDAALREPRSGLLVVGAIEGDKAMGVGRDVPTLLLASPGVDCVVVEADGSRMLPAKAPAAHEPVVPAQTTVHVAVAGIDALVGPIEKTCHRPERVSGIVGRDAAESLDPESLGRLLSHGEGGMKGLPSSARAAILINKVETAEEWSSARRVAAAALAEPRVGRVVLGAIEPSGRADAGLDGELDLRGRYEVHIRS